MNREKLSIRTRDGDCPAYLFRPEGSGPWPAVIFYMDGLGIRPTLLDMGQRLADGALLEQPLHRPKGRSVPHVVIYRKHDTRAMVEDLEGIVRRYPGAALAAAAVVGFVAGRALRNGG